MGVGQPLSRKLKNVHLPHPHPNGGFSEPSLGGGLALPHCLAAMVVGLSGSGAEQGDCLLSVGFQQTWHELLHGKCS